MARLQHCAFMAVTIVAIGTTITSLSHPRGREAPLDIPEYELHTPPHPGDPIGFDVNGKQCLFEANFDALGAYRDAYVEKFPLCPDATKNLSTAAIESAGRRMQEESFIVTGAIPIPYCESLRPRVIRSCHACRCQRGAATIQGRCIEFTANALPINDPWTCEGGKLELRGQFEDFGTNSHGTKFFCNDGCGDLMHGCRRFSDER